MLPFMIEYAGDFQLALKLDGSDDPPVYAWWHDDTWQLWADCFSRCIYLWFWDHLGHFRYYREHRRRYMLAAHEPALNMAELSMLRTQLEELPLAYPTSCTYRFQRGDQHLTIYPAGVYDSDNICWKLEADTVDGIEALLHTVWGCGQLPTTLRSAGNYGLRQEGQSILDLLRQRDQQQHRVPPGA